MAEIILTNATAYANGVAGSSYVVGYESSHNRVVRYTLVSPSSGASSVALTFTNNWWDNKGTLPEKFRFYIGTDPDSHANAGADSEYTGEVFRESGSYVYKGSAEVMLLPGTVYYVWVFPSNTTYGWLYWGKVSGNAVAEVSGGSTSNFTCENGTLGVSQNIAVTQNNTSYTHTIMYICGGVSGTICSKSSSTSIPWTPPVSLASQNTSGQSVSVTITLQTYSGDTAVGSIISKTVTMAMPDSVKPSCSVSVADSTGYAEQYGAYVKGLSRLSVGVTAQESYGAEIQSYNVNANGTTYTEAQLTTEALQSTQNNTVSATVTDTRGRTSDTATETITILDYLRPAITKLTAQRCNASGTVIPQGTNIKVTFSATVSPLNNLNTAQYMLKWKEAGASQYSGLVVLNDLNNNYSVTDYTYIITGVPTTPCQVEIVAEDNHSSESKTANVGVAFSLLHFRADGTGLGIGTTPDQANTAGFGMPIQMNANSIQGLADPVSNTDAANKKYVDEKLVIPAAMTVDVSANTEVSVNLEEGETLSFGYATSYMSNGDIFLKVNGVAPDTGWYAYSGNTSKFSGGIITYSGSTDAADFQGFARLFGGKVYVWGSGMRGNNTGFGWCHNVWILDSVTSLSFNRAGTLFYKKI